MGGAFSIAQGGRGPGGPGRGPLSFCARAHERLLGGAPVAQAGFPAMGGPPFSLCAAVPASLKMAFAASCMSRS